MASLADHFHHPGVQLARISNADIDATAALINAAYAYQDTHKGEPRTNSAHLRKSVAENEFYVAKQEAEIVGCVYVKSGPKLVHFGLLTVADKLRGKGLGSALIAAVAAYAKSIDAETVELDYMSAAPWLKNYYEQHGYTETGLVRNWGTIELIRMSKALR